MAPLSVSRIRFSTETTSVASVLKKERAKLWLRAEHHLIPPIAGAGFSRADFLPRRHRAV
ncbi:MAG TPA: hypothetical protein DEP25_02155 [Candidatus Taylorbacteria bacterium]|nr:hypothetical protein [Candidatus Taylorbacteria bacterium]